VLPCARRAARPGVTIMYEVITFRLRSGVDEAAFLAADALVQTAFAYQRRGLVRRTTARGDDGRWLVIVVWTSLDEADAAAESFGDDPAGREFLDLVDRDSIVIERFQALD
jgi:hypothetical protein